MRLRAGFLEQRRRRLRRCILEFKLDARTIDSVIPAELGKDAMVLFKMDIEGYESRALKGFTRISLKPGERRLVRLALGERDFAFVGSDGRWVVEPGKFEISVGGKQPGLTGTADAATTQVLSATIELTGDAKRLAP